MKKAARLGLEDGSIFSGWAFGADAAAAGEVVFNTAMTGYEEVVTDPSYRGQLVVMTAPQMGNTGWNEEDLESVRPAAGGLIVRELSPIVSNWRSPRSLDEAMRALSVAGLEGIDTRTLTRLLRDKGAMRGVITAESLNALSDAALIDRVKKIPTLDGRDLVREVTCAAPYEWAQPSWLHPSDKVAAIAARHHVVAYDFGLKQNILRQLVDVGCRVTVVPATTTAKEALALKPDGLFFSNGPGDPAAVHYAIDAARDLLATKKPFLGICLGHQILGLALGGTTYKLKFGHHGANQPVKDLQTGKVEITSQNHGFAVDVESLAGKAELSHINLNDGTVEGIRLVDQPAFSVQHHPEASPGPHDASYLFRRFVDMIDQHH